MELAKILLGQEIEYKKKAIDTKLTDEERAEYQVKVMLVKEQIKALKV